MLGLLARSAQSCASTGAADWEVFPVWSKPFKPECWLTNTSSSSVEREEQKGALICFCSAMRAACCSLPLVLIAVSILAASLSGSKSLAGTTVGKVGSRAWGSNKSANREWDHPFVLKKVHHVFYYRVHRLNIWLYPDVERELSQDLWYHSHCDRPGKVKKKKNCKHQTIVTWNLIWIISPTCQSCKHYTVYFVACLQSTKEEMRGREM